MADIHIGNNIARLRGLCQIGQKEMAAKLNILQQDYSKLEHKPMLDDELIEKIAEILNVPVRLIKTLEDQLIQNVYQNDGNTGTGFDYRKMDAELYERLLKEKDEQIRLKDEMLAMKDAVIAMLKVHKG